MKQGLCNDTEEGRTECCEQFCEKQSECTNNFLFQGNTAGQSTTSNLYLIINKAVDHRRYLNLHVRGHS